MTDYQLSSVLVSVSFKVNVTLTNDSIN